MLAQFGFCQLGRMSGLAPKRLESGARGWTRSANTGLVRIRPLQSLEADVKQTSPAPSQIFGGIIVGICEYVPLLNSAKLYEWDRFAHRYFGPLFPVSSAGWHWSVLGFQTRHILDDDDDDRRFWAVDLFHIPDVGSRVAENGPGYCISAVLNRRSLSLSITTRSVNPARTDQPNPTQNRGKAASAPIPNMASDSNGAPPDGANNYQEPPQPQHTPEQLAMIHAAMMEELGITRKDALHLQDRGPDISELRPLKTKRYQETATARWRNLQFDDVDPAEEGLDSIADGQLYRMRRGIPSGPSGRGRGNVASRGGHSSNGGRGFGPGVNGRGGRGDYLGPRGSHQRSDFQTKFQTMRGARNAVNTQGMMETAIARLRNPPLAPRSHRGGAVGVQARPKVMPSKSLNPLPTRSRYAIGNSSNDAFFAHVGISNQRQAPAPAVQQVPVREAAPSPRPVAEVQPSQQSTVAEPNPVVISREPPAPVKSGLSGSRWAPPASSAEPAFTNSVTPAKWAHLGVSPSIIVSPPKSNYGVAPGTLHQGSSAPATPNVTVAPESSIEDVKQVAAQTLSHSGRQLLMTQVVNYKCNDGATNLATVRLIKGQDDIYLTIELIEAGTDAALLAEPVDGNALVETENTLVKYRAASTDSTETPLWKLNFSMPYLAAKFGNMIMMNRLSRPASDTSALLDSAAVCASSNVGQFPPAGSSVSFQTAAHSAQEVMRQNQVVENVRFAQATQQPEPVLDAEYQQAYAGKPSYGPGLEEMQLISFAPAGEDTEQLISFADEAPQLPPQQPVTNPDILILLEFENESVMETLFERSNEGIPGSALTRLSDIVVDAGGPRANTLTPEEILSSKDYYLAAKFVTTNVLVDSETFFGLNYELGDAYLHDKSAKLLKMIVARCYPCDLVGFTLGPEVVPAEATTPAFADFLHNEAVKVESSDTTAFGVNDDIHHDSIKAASAEPVAVTITYAPYSGEPATSPDLGSAENTDGLIKYSPQSLIKLRGNATSVKIVNEPPRDPLTATRRALPPKMATIELKPLADVDASTEAIGNSVHDTGSAAPTDLSTKASPIPCQQATRPTSGPVQNLTEEPDVSVHQPATQAATPLLAPESSQIQVGPSSGQKTDMNLWGASLNQGRSTAAPVPETKPEIVYKHISNTSESTVTSPVLSLPTPTKLGGASQTMSERIHSALKRPLMSTQSATQFFKHTAPRSNAVEVVPSFNLTDTRLSIAAPTGDIPGTTIASEIPKVDFAIVPKTEPTEATRPISILAAGLSGITVAREIPEVVPAVVPKIEPTETIGPISISTADLPDKTLTPEVPQNAPAIENKAEPTPRPVVIKKDPVDEISNFALNGASGLSASRWAPSPTSAVFPRHPQRHPQMGSAVSYNSPRPQYEQKVHAPAYPVGPALTTVLVPDASGNLIHVTGYPVVSAQVATPMPPSFVDHHPRVAAMTPAARNFPARDNTYSPNSSGESSAIDKNSNSASLAPSAAESNQRAPLSTRKGNGLQARLQSRLDNSMAAPRGAYRGPPPY
ncbi:hypothetical protein LZ554_001207 [Drepanopeziza brunnea f. sp. 'monogermtubi']|nr:hypothetical protein LZ554_001207 [Drepanopeziza brunnea f. sp. 'monogermtubi']